MTPRWLEGQQMPSAVLLELLKPGAEKRLWARIMAKLKRNSHEAVPRSG